jgi:hypothetical protein
MKIKSADPAVYSAPKPVTAERGLHGDRLKNQALKELPKSMLLKMVAAPNSMVERINSPDMKPNTPVVKKRPVAISL